VAAARVAALETDKRKMDKLPEAFKATLAVFHGIISTWLFLKFSETTADEFYYVILVIFFSVGNILVWKMLLLIPTWYRYGKKPPERDSLDLVAIRYRPIDVAALTLIAVLVGLTAAYFQTKDTILHVASIFVNWERTSSDDAFQWLFENVADNSMNVIDKRDPAHVKAASGAAFIRVYVKDTKLGYEGYPGITPGKLDRREVILTPACRFSWDENSGMVTKMEVIAGPGVFLELADVNVIEIIDANTSDCSKQIH
jgi:hypothetical protein